MDRVFLAFFLKKTSLKLDDAQLDNWKDMNKDWSRTRQPILLLEFIRGEACYE
jgi:hypothetical protein